jgi:hypothetical protein
MSATRLSAERKHTNRQVSFSGEFHKFLDSLEKGKVSSFLEETGRSTEQFKKWSEKNAKN